MVRFFIVQILFILTLQGWAQNTVQELFLQVVNELQQETPSTQVSPSTHHSFWEKSGIVQIGYLFLGGYQQIISSQDVPACNFYPSCSHFAQEALTQAGFPKNILLISDRLQRCNGLPGKDVIYPFLPDKGRYYDPITNYLTPPNEGND